MIRVGITGGIGTGKTTVCKVFEHLNVPVFYADQTAKQLMEYDGSVKGKLIDLFGKEIYLGSGALNRKKIASIIFNNKIALQKINDVVHPAVRNKFDKWTKYQTSNYVIQEAAILFESGQDEKFDVIITVLATEELKISRVMNRDNIDRKTVLERMKNQISDDIKKAKSDFVIINDDVTMIIPKILEIHNHLNRK